MFLVRKATAEDESAVWNIVKESGLEVDGLPEIESFLIAETETKELFGVIGLETFGAAGLLRALVLNSSESTSEGLLKFFDSVIQYAKKTKLDELYLTSKEESFFFQVFGFSTINGESLPIQMQSNRLFTDQESNRVIMKKRLV
ncbi:GNAT family N-acetyltransferase [Pseudalkalibacillus hwajinpoensis]|uniref:N-acetyltransferase domain-containing protein n=1 Tax=Guptibacillus hwajinpoensis TaxID=208199 RepID=A0A4U1MIK3_9BACL|nr:hypothetical protein [Pseudalkalibacillus hwajinpoensis]TKD70617.1 hypothetical protein FBF83_08295 [Pseudalkalibacillus hwajinpoensis]